jgi:prevent-host-death family protein
MAGTARGGVGAEHEVMEVAAGVFKNTCLALMEEVRTTGRHYVITRHGRPVARLVPAELEGRTAFGFLRGTLLEHGDIVSPDFEAWGEEAP